MIDFSLFCDITTLRHRDTTKMLDISNFDDVFSFNPNHAYPAATVTLIQGNRKKLGLGGMLFVERLFGVLGMEGFDAEDGVGGTDGVGGGKGNKSKWLTYPFPLIVVTLYIFLVYLDSMLWAIG